MNLVQAVVFIYRINQLKYSENLLMFYFALCLMSIIWRKWSGLMTHLGVIDLSRNRLLNAIFFFLRKKKLPVANYCFLIHYLFFWHYMLYNKSYKVIILFHIFCNLYKNKAYIIVSYSFSTYKNETFLLITK